MSRRAANPLSRCKRIAPSGDAAIPTHAVTLALTGLLPAPPELGLGLELGLAWRADHGPDHAPGLGLGSPPPPPPPPPLPPSLRSNSQPVVTTVRPGLRSCCLRCRCPRPATDGDVFGRPPLPVSLLVRAEEEPRPEAEAEALLLLSLAPLCAASGSAPAVFGRRSTSPCPCPDREPVLVVLRMFRSRSPCGVVRAVPSPSLSPRSIPFPSPSSKCPPECSPAAWCPSSAVLLVSSPGVSSTAKAGVVPRSAACSGVFGNGAKSCPLGTAFDSSGFVLTAGSIDVPFLMSLSLMAWKPATPSTFELSVSSTIMPIDLPVEKLVSDNEFVYAVISSPFSTAMPIISE
jgi:hypothetical protein